MTIIRSTFTAQDGSSYPRLEIAPQCDWALFDRIAGILEVELGGTWSERLDGKDERYWDLRTASGKLTLHLQHYLGISLYPTGGAKACASTSIGLGSSLPIRDRKCASAARRRRLSRSSPAA